MSDSSKYVISLDTENGTLLILKSLTENHEANLSTILSFGVEATELHIYGYANKDG